MSELPVVAARALGQLEPDWPLTEVENVEWLSGGYSNDNYAFEFAGHSYVLRVVRSHVRSVDRAFERQLLEGPLAGLAPPLVAFRIPEGHMLTRRVHGSLLVDAAVGVDAMVDYLARLHSRMPSLERRYDVARVVTDDFTVAAERDQPAPQWAVQCLDALTPPRFSTPCHNDLNPWNVVVTDADPARWCTLDWEFAGDNDPLFDVLCIAAGLEWDAQQTDALIDAYFERRGQALPERVRRRSAWFAYWLREFAWAFAQRSLGNTRPEIAAQLERSRSALARLNV
jgi:thiamine kinase-like enzyme